MNEGNLIAAFSLDIMHFGEPLHTLIQNQLVDVNVMQPFLCPQPYVMLYILTCLI